MEKIKEEMFGICEQAFLKIAKTVKQQGEQVAKNTYVIHFSEPQDVDVAHKFEVIDGLRVNYFSDSDDSAAWIDVLKGNDYKQLLFLDAMAIYQIINILIKIEKQ